MKPQQPYETATMARVYAQQGYLLQAARIYRRLLREAPQREDLKAALTDIESRMAAQKGPSRRELGALLREWADLAARKKS
jgi:hypothetical protein